MKHAMRGDIANVAVLILAAYLLVDHFVENGAVGRLGVVALALLIVAAAAGIAGRRSARSQIRSALATQALLADTVRRRDAYRELSDSAFHGASLDELFDRAAAMLERNVPGSRSAIFELRPELDDLRLRAGVGWSEGVVGNAAIGAGPNSHAYATLAGSAPVLIMMDRGTLPADASFLNDEGIVRGVAMVLLGSAGPFGMIALYATERGEYPARDVMFLQMLANFLTSVLVRRGAEDSFRLSEERLRLALEVTQIGTWDDDLDAGTAVWSKGLREIMGVDATIEPGYERFVSLIHPDDREQVARTIAAAVATGGEYEIDSCRVCRPDGEVRDVFARGTIFRNDEGTPTRMVGVALDVTEKQQAQSDRTDLEEQLRQAQKMEVVGQLAGGIAHDFNNLLLALRGYGELALRAITRGEDARPEVEEMLASAERAAALTRQLLAFSRRQILQPKIVDLNLVISQIATLLERLIGEDVSVDVVAATGPIAVYADRNQLEQVITNLAVNARHAMPDGGKLTIEISVAEIDAGLPTPLEPGDYAVLSVSDTGVGMDAETAAQVFEPFFTTKEGLGTGLGLAMVHGIVKQSGGHIRVYSEPGLGTTFRIYLPLIEDSTAVKASVQAAPDGQGELVLLVEDDAEVRMFVREMLIDTGYRVLVARSGEDALELAQGRLDIEIVVTDVVMQGLNGRETVERLRETHPDVAVLYMSGYTDDAVLRSGALERGTAFLQKPFGTADLARKVRQVHDAR